MDYEIALLDLDELVRPREARDVPGENSLVVADAEFRLIEELVAVVRTDRIDAPVTRGVGRPTYGHVNFAVGRRCTAVGATVENQNRCIPTSALRIVEHSRVAVGGVRDARWSNRRPEKGAQVERLHFRVGGGSVVDVALPVDKLDDMRRTYAKAVIGRGRAVVKSPIKLLEFEQCPGVPTRQGGGRWCSDSSARAPAGGRAGRCPDGDLRASGDRRNGLVFGSLLGLFDVLLGRRWRKVGDCYRRLLCVVFEASRSSGAGAAS